VYLPSRPRVEEGLGRPKGGELKKKKKKVYMVIPISGLIVTVLGKVTGSERGDGMSTQRANEENREPDSGSRIRGKKRGRNKTGRTRRLIAFLPARIGKL